MADRTRSCRVPADHPALAGHFPGAPVVPGVVLIELVVETIGTDHGAMALLSIPSVKFFRPVFPEQTFSIVYGPTAPGAWSFRCEDADGPYLSGLLRCGPIPT